jgi:hypothetical protein
VIALTFKAMGSAAWLAMGFKNQNVLSSPSGETSTAQATDPAANHDYLSAFWHPSPIRDLSSGHSQSQL